MIYLVTRHQGAVEWCARQNVQVDAWLPHLDVETIQVGDTVIGTL
ncbi:CRISPR-associated protein Csx16, partial [Salinivibrio sp. IB282]